MVAVSTSVLGVELVPPKWLLPASVSPGEVPVTSWPSGYSLRSAGRFDSSFFLISLCTGTQNVCLCVCVCVCVRFLCVSLQTGVSLSYSPLDLSYSSPTGFKASHSWGLPSQCRACGLGSPMSGPNPLLFGTNLCNCNHSPLLWLEVWVLTILKLWPLYPFHCGSFLNL